jgi:hypothetical protein
VVLHKGVSTIDNHDDYFKNIVHPANINFEAIPGFITSSRDPQLVCHVSFTHSPSASVCPTAPINDLLLYVGMFDDQLSLALANDCRVMASTSSSSSILSQIHFALHGTELGDLSGVTILQSHLS